MFTYSKKDIEILRQVTESLAGRGADFDLVEMISYKIMKEGETVEHATKRGIAEYLCFNAGVFFKEYDAMGIDKLIFDTPIDDIPLYINYEGKELVKKIVARWRLKINK